MADKPKRPLSAYMIWLAANREDIKRESPGIKVTEIAKRGGELWRAMKDKSEWEHKATEAKDRYTKELAAFEANGGDTSSGKKKKVVRKPAPKKGKKKEESDESEEEEDESD